MIFRAWKWFWGPTSRFGWGAILIAGVLGGILFWGGFNTLMEHTNTLSFCTSCHEMRQFVFEDYKETVHYKNASGVRVVCSDCHVPRDWGRKLIRKIKASSEVYHKLIGTISTQEKFDDKQLELAERVWASMESSDSRECRNCHSYEAMDFDEQGKRAAEKMEHAQEKGKTCIECHKGIAHKLPEDYDD
jgi:nitrate/TMAO reductase-like tetraheme cytochrome c subunit